MHSKQVFEIKFVQSKVSVDEWDNLLVELLKVSQQFEFIIDLRSNPIGFYLFSERNLCPLTLKIFPFVVMNSDHSVENLITPFLSRNTKTYFKKLNTDESFFSFVNNQKIKGNSVSLLHLQFHKRSFFNYEKTKIRGKVLFTNNRRSFVKRIKAKNISGKFFALSQKSTLGTNLPILKPFLEISEGLEIASDSGKFISIEGIANEKKYLNIDDYDFWRHTLVIGQSGVGKTKFIESFINNISQLNNSDEYRVVVIDPHLDLTSTTSSISGSSYIDFVRRGIAPFYSSKDKLISTELTLLLLKNVLESNMNPKLERVLKHTLYVLFSSEEINFKNLSTFLTDVKFRKEILKNVALPDVVINFFENDFTEMAVKYYVEAILPILNLIEELFFIPAIQDSEKQIKLLDLLSNSQTVLFGLNKMTLGDRALKTIAGLIILQTFLVAQSRLLNKKIILIIDEFALVQNDSIAQILSEARKFDLSLVLSTQYLSQIDNSIIQSLLSNVVNSFVFKISHKDAKIIETYIPIEFDQSFSKTLKDSYQGFNDIRTDVFTNLNPREVVVQLMKNNKYVKPFNAKTLDVIS